MRSCFPLTSSAVTGVQLSWCSSPAPGRTMDMVGVVPRFAVLECVLQVGVVQGYISQLLQQAGPGMKVNTVQIHHSRTLIHYHWAGDAARR